MVLSGSKKVTYISSISNQNQGGGSKKAGLKPTIGETAWDAIFFGAAGIVSGRCCDANKMAMTMNPNVMQSRPISTLPMNWGSVNY